MNASDNCQNCGSNLTGRFCSHCGQAAGVHVPSTRELLHEALEGLTHSDSRLLLTLKFLLIKPGKLTQEFVAGRRAAYLPPFRLYLIMSVAFFLIASFSHFNGPVVSVDKGDLHRTDESDCTNGNIDFPVFARHPDWQKRFQRACIGVVHDNGDSLLHVGVATMPKAMFIFLPLVAFLHMLLYWWPRYRYAVHLLFFLHLHAFFFLVTTLLALFGYVAGAWPALHSTDERATQVLLWVTIIYSVFAMRRVFQMGWLLTLVKAFVLFFVYIGLLGLTVAIVFIYAALQL